jgi:hypothetical protein
MKMNDELKNKSVEILTQIQQAVQSGAEVAGQQIPDIAGQYVVYGMFWNWALVLFFAGAIGAVWFIARAGAKKFEGCKFDIYMAAVFCTSLALIPFFVYLESALLVTLAPKVWLIKEIADLIK